MIEVQRHPQFPKVLIPQDIRASLGDMPLQPLLLLEVALKQRGLFRQDVNVPHASGLLEDHPLAALSSRASSTTGVLGLWSPHA